MVMNAVGYNETLIILARLNRCKTRGIMTRERPVNCIIAWFAVSSFSPMSANAMIARLRSSGDGYSFELGLFPLASNVDHCFLVQNYVHLRVSNFSIKNEAESPAEFDTTP